jgi:hypothetical protein
VKKGDKTSRGKAAVVWHSGQDRELHCDGSFGIRYGRFPLSA